MLSLRTLLRSSRSVVTISQHGFKSVSTSKFGFNGRLLAPTCCFQTPQQTVVAQQLRLYASSSPKEVEDVRVYHGSLAPRMKAVKIFSLTTSLAGLAAQPILLEQGLNMGGKPMAVFLCTFAGFFTFVTPLLLHFITKKYVTEIHYNPKTEEYTATTISLLLFKIKTKFKPEHVKVPEVPGMFTSFLVHDKPLFVDPALFEDPDHYARIMGYDKPVDFKLDFTDNSAKADKTNKKAQ
ncbi:transmembrane protein 70 homolog, mitochondrial [Zeugodacus cucurbitae]|uniref:Transmembrane protein 70 homolog, mitochondrial n=1 Tax=Zeugodacus cucurbitae TaxID=28588 RepID=A0A0A1WM23_ZEUCU|nr:transmembrane protein 70 homolog, mitochondrial [Zeugodacus cucurbitae]